MLVSPEQAATVLGVNLEMLEALRELPSVEVDGVTHYHLDDLVLFTGRGSNRR